MKVGDELLEAFYPQGKSIRRASWPVGDHISTDGAYDGEDRKQQPHGTIWYYTAEEDEMTPGYGLDFHDLAADDWEII